VVNEDPSDAPPNAGAEEAAAATGNEPAASSAPGWRPAHAICLSGLYPKGRVRIGHVEINDIVAPVSGDRPRDALSQVAVRVDQHHAAAMGDILQCKCLEQRRLARPGLPDDVHMKKPVGLFDAERRSLISKIDMAEIGDCIIRMRHADSLFCRASATKTRLYALSGTKWWGRWDA
jgi:hypothetical protein